MYYNPLTKEEEFHELVKEIESQSAYKRQPPLEKKPILAGAQELFQNRSDPWQNACGVGKL